MLQFFPGTISPNSRKNAVRAIANSSLIQWKKRLTDGRMKNVAFVLDPDNYWIEVIQNEKLRNRANW